VDLAAVGRLAERSVLHDLPCPACLGGDPIQRLADFAVLPEPEASKKPGISSGVGSWRDMQSVGRWGGGKLQI
jgi:hypothetical protein